jgi:hypothetical protein
MPQRKQFPEIHDFFSLGFACIQEVVVDGRIGHEHRKGGSTGRGPDGRSVDYGGCLLATNYAEGGARAPGFPIYRP